MEKEILFNKSADGMVPAIIQDHITRKVLMQGYMNRESLEKTIADGKITFFSRSKNRLWTKGEESGNYLKLISYAVDCDGDSLLFKVEPAGPVCHTGADTCWDETNQVTDFLQILEKVIEERKNGSDDKSYVKSLMLKGVNKVAQKVGEEAVELVIEAKDDDQDKFLNEAADLLFHYLLLLNMKGFNLQDVKDILEKRHRS
ncbi:MAG: bifunctional phosphoribosyl-AMP cyclohydrolase/phosphoribosyl-ATP diphosphatase HisIE [Chitinophagia bacterium]|jgi:phosphoribosyl-ATP pyrophosphohydrolase/phosphoribosyl-AMP cyclohydrolase